MEVSATALPYSHWSSKLLVFGHILNLGTSKSCITEAHEVSKAELLEPTPCVVLATAEAAQLVMTLIVHNFCCGRYPLLHEAIPEVPLGR